MILCANPNAQYLANKNGIDTAVLDVLESGIYILGEQVSLFEQEFAEIPVGQLSHSMVQEGVVKA